MLQAQDCPKCGKAVFVTVHDSDGGNFRCQCFDCFPVEHDEYHFLTKHSEILDAFHCWNTAVLFFLYMMEEHCDSD